MVHYVMLLNYNVEGFTRSDDPSVLKTVESALARWEVKWSATNT
jgi:hypothetical protein